jgi:hypothetical protein
MTPELPTSRLRGRLPPITHPVTSTPAATPTPAMPAADPAPRGALMIVGVVFFTVLSLWFLVLGVLQARA